MPRGCRHVLKHEDRPRGVLDGPVAAADFNSEKRVLDPGALAVITSRLRDQARQDVTVDTSSRGA